MPLPKPVVKPAWTQGNPSPGVVRVEPTNSKKQEGWNIDERPPREFMNWLFWIIDEWIKYLESVTDQSITTLYQAFVGTGPAATHADLNAVMADGAIPAGSRILVLSSATITTPQQITKNRIQIDFQPGVIYTDGGTTSAIQVSADYVRINGGEFFNFAGGGDAAILIDAIADHTKIRDCHFRTCANGGISDLASTSSITGTTEEA